MTKSSSYVPLTPYLQLHRLRNPLPNPITNPLRPLSRPLLLSRILFRLRNLFSRVFRI